MRTALAAGALAILLAGTAFAQRGGFAGGFRSGGFRGFSGGVRGGFGSPGFGHRGGFISPGFGHRISPGFGHRGFISPGFRRGGFVSPGFGIRGGFGFGRGIGLGFSRYRRSFGFGYGGFSAGLWPVFVGGVYSAPAYYPPLDAYTPSPPNVIIIMPENSDRQMIVERRTEQDQTVTPRIREYGTSGESAASGAQSEPPQIHFLIPLKDGAVRAAVAYWIEDATLHFIDSGGDHRQTPVASVDRKRAEELNEGRIIQFRLPPER